MGNSDGIGDATVRSHEFVIFSLYVGDKVGVTSNVYIRGCYRVAEHGLLLELGNHGVECSSGGRMNGDLDGEDLAQHKVHHVGANASPNHLGGIIAGILQCE